MTRLVVLMFVAALVVVQTAGAAPQKTAPPRNGVASLLLKLEQTIAAGLPDAYFDLLSERAIPLRAAQAAQSLIDSDITRAVVRERDRAPLDGTLPGDGYRLMIEILTERGIRARITTWQLDVRRTAGTTAEGEWRISDQNALTALDGLFRLALNPVKQYRVRNLSLRSDDLSIDLADGRMFVAEATGGPTAVVLMPSRGGKFVFKPTPATERGQVRIYCGSDVLQDQYTTVFVRVHPDDFDTWFPAATLSAEPVDQGLFGRAAAVFREDVTKSFGLDLADLSRDAWSSGPQRGDLLAEIHTKQFRTLTYTKVLGEPEDISLFDRARRRNISVYPSASREASQGRFFNEDAHAPFAVESTDLNLTIDPDRYWLEGVARIRLRVKDPALNRLTLRLAESLAITGIYSPEFGRLLSLRVRNQASAMISLPAIAASGTEITLLVGYSGRLVPPPPDHEGIGPQFPQDPAGVVDEVRFTGEPSALYSINSAWYPQGAVASYGSARMKLTVPERFQVLASGSLVPGFPKAAPAINGKIPAIQYEFDTTQPVRYLACVISRFERVGTTTIPTTYEGAGDVGGVSLSLEANPRQVTKGREMLPIAERVFRHYTSIIGDAPYQSLTVGLIEGETPGGHSPAYLSLLNQPLPASTFNWSHDPAAFPNFPEFFVAHELAHQWWGQAVGWRSYHERWISEGFAQYFAALYARQVRGDEAFDDLIRQMARWGRDKTEDGPISLGYRLGHIRGDSQIFRAIAYNKSAVVLDMLRRRLGDEMFFRGLRRFYKDWRFRKAGTDNVQQAFEAESGQSLEQFFEQWIHGTGVPVLKPSWQQDPEASSPTVVVRLEQIGVTYEYPVTVTVRYTTGPAEDALVSIVDRVTELRLPLKGRLRDVVVNRDGLTIVDIARR
ncbi:MAG: M1 family aminopeptidase [Acidobacteria bacterium]|nr:M1 family aminopeptidase [Acidobacteriota bacterium]